LPSIHPSIVILSWRHCYPRQRDTLAVSIARLPSAAFRHRPAGSHEHASNHTQQHLRLQANTSSPTNDCISPRFLFPENPNGPDAGFFRRHSLLHSPAGQQTDRRIAGIVTWS
jgi:hypothetical protein